MATLIGPNTARADKSRGRIRLLTDGEETLFKRFCVKFGEGVVFNGETYFDGMATHFAVFDVGLAKNRSVQHH